MTRLAGRGRPIDEAGNRYGRLSVVALAQENPSGKGRQHWICRCDCGRERTVLGASLRSGNTTSCGCLRNERAIARVSKPAGVAPLNKVLANIEANARRRGIPWLIERRHAEGLIGQACFYCGVEPLQRGKAHKQTLLYNGIDRLDSARPYVDGNVVPCCGTCNNAKRAMTLRQFTEWAKRLHATLLTRDN